MAIPQVTTDDERQVTELDLTTPNTLRLFQQYLASVVIAGAPEDAYKLVRGLEGLLKQQSEVMQHPSEFSRGYAEILDTAKGIVLQMLGDDEVVSYLEKGIVAAFRNPDVNAFDALKTAIDLKPYVEDMDDFKKKLSHALYQNRERLTLQSLRTGHGVVPPTVHDWLEVAKQYVTEFNRPYAYAVQDDENFRKLQHGEQEIVLRAMAVYDLLTIPSKRPGNYATTITVRGTDGRMYVLDEDEVRPAYEKRDEELVNRFLEPGQPVSPAAPAAQPPRAQEVRSTLQKLQQDKKSLDDAQYAAQEALIKEAGSDVGRVVEKLAGGLASGDRDAIVVSVFVLARYGALETAMRDERVRTEFEEEFVGALAAKSGVPTDLAFEITVKNFAAPTTIGSFLYWSLQKALGDDAESARIGNQVGSIVAALGRPEFVRMTYFDVKTGSYHWTPVTLQKDGTLAWVE